MINEHDIEDMKPEKFEEDINDDKAYWVNMELGPIKMAMGYGRFKIGSNQLQEES